VEVDLCGHATLAAAHALWATGRVEPARPLAFHTRSGVLRARRRGEGRAGVVEMDFPATPPVEVEGPGAGEEDRRAVCRAFGCREADVLYLGESAGRPTHVPRRQWPSEA
jgi:predicted PhzF superfamily epimerase YddE/YHI9